MKNFKGKAIYNPSGKAGEYSYWACNFHVGCSGMCSYCYCKKGILARSMGFDIPVLKSCFRNEDDAMHYLIHETHKNMDALKKHGLFFSFTTDPMLPETWPLVDMAINFLIGEYDIPVKILTKQVQFIDSLLYKQKKAHLIAIGFTLTGHDELEPGCSSNLERIRAMIKLHKAGFKTWASIEPIIDFPSAKNMIKWSLESCDLYKVGLMSGKKYDIVEAQSFVEWLNELQEPKIYMKESLQKLTHYTNAELDEYFVEADYNIFNQ